MYICTKNTCIQINPFLTTGYISKEYFCDREKETENLINYCTNGNNVTLVSLRRLGKSGLIQHVFENLKDNETIETIYVDIYSTRTLEDLIKTISEAILKKFPEKTPFGKIFWDFIKRLRPLISFDNITGDPQVQIIYQSEHEKTSTIQNLFEIIEKQNKRVIIAIDEFQQINEYPEKNIEAILRSQIQFLKNITFIFCGSKQSILYDMFSNAKRPFYMSTQFMNLDKIENNKYAEFIKEKFEKGGVNVTNEAINLILSLTKTYTFYTQKLCNKLYGLKPEQIDIELVKNSYFEIIEENKLSFLQIRELLTKAQWNYLIAIAKEEGISKITSQDFLMRYKIGTASNSKRLMKALIEKDLINKIHTIKESTYCINDVFLNHWLKESY